MTLKEQDNELREKLNNLFESVFAQGVRAGKDVATETYEDFDAWHKKGELDEALQLITADRKRIKELGLEQAQEIYNSVQKEKVEKQKAVSENEKIREMLNDPEVIGKAVNGAIKAQRKMAGLESEEK